MKKPDTCRRRFRPDERGPQRLVAVVAAEPAPLFFPSLREAVGRGEAPSRCRRVCPGHGSSVSVSVHRRCVSSPAGSAGAAWLIPGLGVGGPGGTAATLVGPPPGWNISPPIWIAAAGLLIGFGTKLGNGCTSGHGVCGLARLSKRSMVAVAVFFSVAILTVTVTGIV